MKRCPQGTSNDWKNVPAGCDSFAQACNKLAADGNGIVFRAGNLICCVLMSIQRHTRRWALPAVTVSLLVLIGGMAALALWKAHELHKQLVHSEATRSVLETGSRITSGLARYVLSTPSSNGPRNWWAFAQMVRAVGVSEEQLQYVSVKENGVTVFQAHTRSLLGGEQEAWEEQINPALVEPGRQVLNIGTNLLPVVTFALPFEGANEVAYEVNVGLRKDAIAREEQSAARVIRALLRLTTGTILFSFSTAILVIVWMVFREEQHARRRRSEEHLAYAGVVAGGIAHDFRNPMSSLRLDVQMLRKEAAKGDACDFARVTKLTERICHITERMEKVFQEFLFLSREGRADKETLNAGALLRESMAVAQPRMEAAGVTVRDETGGEAVMVSAQPEPLRRAILNLLINAEQHAGAEGRVLVRLSRRRRTAVIDIANTGTGVPRAERKKIFELFYTTRPGGTGLGLFQARAAVQQNGGQLTLEKLEPYAACFRVELPLAREEVGVSQNEDEKNTKTTNG